MEIAKEAFKEPVFLSPEEISDIVRQHKEFTDWLKAVNTYALDQALNHGVQWPGMKIVEGIARRKYGDEEKAASALIKLGFNSTDIYDMELKGITEMTKLLGKSDFEKHVAEFVIKPSGKPVLVDEKDKRPAFSSVEKAREAFKDE